VFVAVVIVAKAGFISVSCGIGAIGVCATAGALRLSRYSAQSVVVIHRLTDIFAFDFTQAMLVVISSAFQVPVEGLSQTVNKQLFQTLVC
jgi:hypothetical protein